MTELNELLENYRSVGVSGSDRRSVKVPESWRPRVELGSDGGFIITPLRAAGEVPGAADLLAEHGLDPDQWSLTNMRHSSWETANGQTLTAYRFSVVPIEKMPERDFDLDKLMTEVSKWRPRKRAKNSSGEHTFIFAPSDQQIGKKQGGEGTPEAIARILWGIEGGVHRLEELRACGRSIGTIVIALPGDHVEGTVSQKGRLQGQAASDLGLDEQLTVARRLLMAQIREFAPLCDRLIVAGVNGNHDEVTRQVVTDPAAGWNTFIIGGVQDICAENPDLFGHVTFRVPGVDQQTLVVNIGGDTDDDRVLMGLFHGHQVGNGTSQAIFKYLANQSAGKTSLGGADFWISGHFHNFQVMDVGPRLWVQAPTTDPGSAWFRDKSGYDSPTGVLTMVAGPGHDPRRDISVIPTGARTS